jgi:threonyl-tRNA synthetase
VGPHVPSTGRLKAFKLLSTSNAYWKGDARNQPMQRIYGTAFFSDKELKAHLQRIEEAKKRDHRKLGRELGLFTFHPWAPGAAFWLAKGTRLYHTLADYMRGVLFPNGYVEVKTPLVFNKALWETSGHWQHYRENMFLVESGDEQMGVKAMNCPGHMLVFASEVRSYRDLPLRFTSRRRCTATSLGRAVGPHARAPVLAGRCALLRDGGPDRRGGRAPARGSCSASTATSASSTSEALDAARRVPRRGRHVGPRRGGAEERARAAGSLRPQRGRRRLLRAEDRLRRHRRDRAQVAVRHDPARLPAAERFDLKYIGADNAEHRPVVIHRAIFGSFERFIALLIEHYAGAFPLWLAPVQAVVLPIADRHAEYARRGGRLTAAGLRVEVDERQEKIGYKIREAQLQKVPYMLVIGDREAAEGTVAVRSRTGGDLGAQDRRRSRLPFEEVRGTKGRPVTYRHRRPPRGGRAAKRARAAIGLARSAAPGGSYRFRQIAPPTS